MMNSTCIISPVPRRDTHPATAMIRLCDVTKTFRRGSTHVPALRGVSCEIAAGAMTFVLGPSGSGKSTLLYLMGALDEPTSGEVLVAGRSLAELSSRERDAFRRDEVGFVFQSFNLLSNLSALDNVLVPYMPAGISPRRREWAATLLTQVGLADRLDHRPHQLSGGEQQRVAIARALLKRPALVLADEPTGELDSQNGAEVFAYLRQLCHDAGSTVVVVTHDPSYAAPEDRRLFLRDGVLVES